MKYFWIGLMCRIGDFADNQLHDPRQAVFNVAKVLGAIVGAWIYPTITTDAGVPIFGLGAAGGALLGVCAVYVLALFTMMFYDWVTNTIARGHEAALQRIDTEHDSRTA